jgi:hypothetical protein
MISNLDDDNVDNNVTNYWDEEFQLTKNDKNILLNPNGWLSD